jgi:hypothetical protein
VRGLVHNPAREAPDGVRRVFHVLEPYVEGTLVFCLNGRPHVDDWRVTGWLTVELDEAPQADDMVSFFYQQV